MREEGAARVVDSVWGVGGAEEEGGGGAVCKEGGGVRAGAGFSMKMHLYVKNLYMCVRV